MSKFNYVEDIAIHTGLVEHFEITYELLWKLIVYWLGENIPSDTAEGISRRQFFRLPQKTGLSKMLTNWMQSIKGVM